ncbi:MAG TPA: trypsin-like peptidase domain-containing protein [Acidimicrobiales bacterium]|nr:trypsin-like peptidase domain-containing protein [Acidimicrobiales bacterium]
MAPPSPKGRAPLRGLVLPKTVLGMAVLILAFAVGSAASGVAFYSYYEFKKDKTEQRVATFLEGFDKRFQAATKTIEAERQNAKAEIQKELEPLRRIRAEGETLDALVKKVRPSLFFVNTLDEAGQPSVGTAFAVASDSEQTLLITSYNTIKAATRKPGPALQVRQGGDEFKAELWTWQEDKDLALLVLAKGSVPRLPFADKEPPMKTGERLFIVSGLGGAGGSITQGFVADVSGAGLQHDAAVGQSFQGGPLINSEGEVLAIASRAYAPLGFTSEGVYFAPLVRAACEKVVKCPGGDTVGRGDKR